MPRVNVKDKRKQQLIDANIASIAKRGLSETTIAHVSQGAGMSRGIVNFYFNTKETMMRETCQYLAEEYTGAWERALEKATDASAEDKLKALVTAHFQSNLCNQKKLAVWVAFWGHASSHSAYKKIIAEADEKFAKAVGELWDGVNATGISADRFVYELHALIRGSWLNFLLSTGASDREALAAKCQDFLARAMDVEAGAPATNAAKVKQASNVTPLKTAEEKAAARKKARQAEEEAALGDLFAAGN